MCFLLVSRSDSDLPDSKDQKLIGNSFQFLTVRIVVFLVKLFLKFYGICQFYSRLYTQSLKLFQYFIFLLKIVSSNMLFITHTKNWWSTCKHVGNWAKKLQTKKELCNHILSYKNDQSSNSCCFEKKLFYDFNIHLSNRIQVF